MSGQKTALILLRIGSAFGFFYAAIFSFLNPNGWIGFFPIFLRDFFGANLILPIFSFYELVLGFWLISGKWPVISATTAALSVFSIIIFNFGAMDIVFRDVTIFFAALSLVLLSRQTS